MAEYAYNQRQTNLYSVDSSSSSRNLASPRTIEEILRQKYSGLSSVSKENSFSLSMSSPAAQLEQVLANSRFAKRQVEISSTPRFQPRQVQVSIKDLEKKLQENEKRSLSRGGRGQIFSNIEGGDKSGKIEKVGRSEKEYRAVNNSKDKRDLSNRRDRESSSNDSRDFKDLRDVNNFNKDSKTNKTPNVTKQSLELIQRLREEVRNRSGFLEPEEPPDLLDMNVIDRNAFWLQSRRQKIEEQRKAKQDRELDGCTFRPALNTPRMRTPSSVRSKSPNSSYCQQYARRKNYRSLSTGKLTARFVPRELRNEELHLPEFVPSNLSPTDKNYSYRAGINLNSFLMRAQPVVDYRYLNK